MRITQAAYEPPIVNFYCGTVPGSSLCNIGSGQSVGLVWTTTYADSCVGDWPVAQSNKNTAGGESTGALTSSRSYKLTCSNEYGDITRETTKTVNVNVDLTLSGGPFEFTVLTTPPADCL